MQYSVNIGLNFVLCEQSLVEFNRSSTTVHFHEYGMALALIAWLHVSKFTANETLINVRGFTLCCEAFKARSH